jgi:hypothetical protein
MQAWAAGLCSATMEVFLGEQKSKEKRQKTSAATLYVNIGMPGKMVP